MHAKTRKNTQKHEISQTKYEQFSFYARCYNKEVKISVAEGEGTNLSFTAPSAGDYIFSFNESTKILKITRASS